MNITEKIMNAAIELIEVRAQMQELQRAFPYVRSSHFYPRMEQLRKTELVLEEQLEGIRPITERKSSKEIVQYIYTRVE